MDDPQTTNGDEAPSQQSLTSLKTDQESHFARARKIVESWPEWKRNIRCAPILPNSNQSAALSDESR
jgi:hypothetical protein